MTEQLGILISLLGTMAGVAANFAAFMKWSGRIESKVDGLDERFDGVGSELLRQRDGLHEVRNELNVVHGKQQVLEQRIAAHHDRLVTIEQRCESRAPLIARMSHHRDGHEN